MRKLIWLLPLLVLVSTLAFTSGSSLAQTCHIGSDGQCVLQSSEEGQGTSSEAPPGSSEGNPSTSESIESLRERMLALVNSERAKANLPGLVVQPWAESIAAEHSIRMAVAKSIWHNDDYFANGRKAMGANLLGENVAMGVSVEGAHRSLMESPPHRQNILDPRFAHLGIGIARGEDEMIYVTQGFARIPAVASHPTPPPQSNSEAPTQLPDQAVSGVVTVSVVIDETQAASVPKAPSVPETDSLVLSANSAASELNLFALAMCLLVAVIMLTWRSRLNLKELAAVRARAALLVSVLSNE